MIEELNPDVHDRASFTCGREEIDRYLKTQANRYQAANLCTTHVLVGSNRPEVGAEIIGFATLVQKSIPLGEDFSKLNKMNQQKPIPALLLAQMGVNKGYQGRGYGRYLVGFAIKCYWEICRLSAIPIMVVDAATPSLIEFYKEFSFTSSKDRADRMFLPLDVLKRAHDERARTRTVGAG